MPIYEYTCRACEGRFEQLVRSMNGQSNVKCPECGSSRTARVLSVFAVGAEAGGKSPSQDLPPGMCGRCGGPGPCAME
jgi:putative FmdB family regulatory protein